MKASQSIRRSPPAVHSVALAVRWQLGVHDGPLSPVLRANPFPEVTDLLCRIPLSTLFYRPEAANLGDLMRLWVRPGVRIKQVGGQAVLGRQDASPTPWLTERHGYDPSSSPQSQSFSRSYGSIMPNSLIYIILSTRGC